MRTFVFVVYVAFGALALIAAATGIVMLIAGNVLGCVVGLVSAAVLYLMSLSVKKSHREMA